MRTPDLAEKYDRAYSTIKEWRLDLYRRGDLLWWPGIRLDGAPEYSDHLETDDDVIITGDLEVPYHDPQLLGYIVAVAQLFDIKSLVIAGDFIANDAIGYHTQFQEDTDWGGG